MTVQIDYATPPKSAKPDPRRPMRWVNVFAFVLSFGALAKGVVINRFILADEKPVLMGLLVLSALLNVVATASLFVKLHRTVGQFVSVVCVWPVWVYGLLWAVYVWR